MIFRGLSARRAPAAQLCFITHQKGRMLRAPRAPARSRRSAQLRGARITGGTRSEQMSQMRKKGREAARRPGELGAAGQSAGPRRPPGWRGSEAGSSRGEDSRPWSSAFLTRCPLLSSKDQGGGWRRCPGLPPGTPRSGSRLQTHAAPGGIPAPKARSSQRQGGRLGLTALSPEIRLTQLRVGTGGSMARCTWTCHLPLLSS